MGFPTASFRSVLLAVAACAPSFVGAQSVLAPMPMVGLPPELARLRDKFLLRIITLRDLDFGVGKSGDPARVIRPGRAQIDGRPARFIVIGIPFHRIRLLLPASIELRNVDNPALRIGVSRFAADIAVDGEWLGPLGVRTFEIGATREALRRGVGGGRYEGRFAATVVYVF